MQMSTLCKHLGILVLAGALSACAAQDGRRSTAQYADDKVTEASVKEALVTAPDLRSSTIQVEVFEGVVQLSGFADSEAAANRAVQAARSVEGVKEVRNDMRIRPANPK